MNRYLAAGMMFAGLAYPQEPAKQTQALTLAKHCMGQTVATNVSYKDYLPMSYSPTEFSGCKADYKNGGKATGSLNAVIAKDAQGKPDYASPRNQLVLTVPLEGQSAIIADYKLDDLADKMGVSFPTDGGEAILSIDVDDKNRADVQGIYALAQQMFLFFYRPTPLRYEGLPARGVLAKARK
jgi:hypothetical protein